MENELNLMTYSYVGAFKSIRRAIKRGKCTPWGMPISKRLKHNGKRSTRKGRK